jgi:hypothetical protein
MIFKHPIINAMSKFSTIPLLLFVVVQIGYSQQPSVREWLEVADSSYQEGNYPAAFKYYEAALKYRLNAKDSLDILYKYAESARHFNAFEPAEKAYQVVVDKSKEHPLSRYWLAIVEQQQEKYEEAELHFEQFLQQTPAPDAMYQTLAQRGLENTKQARSTSGLPQPIAPTRLARGINETNAEYASAFMGDTLVYSTLNNVYKKDTHKPPRKYTEIYNSVGGQTGTPWESLNEPGKHVSNLVFNQNQTVLYYTVCEYKENSVIEVRCDLYMRPKETNGTWGEKKKLTINMPDQVHTTTQPALAFDAQTKKEFLFFVTDRPLNAADTTKDLNIWYGTIEANGDIATATPVDALNTDGNEASPAFYQPTQTLYFSSDGRTPNYGGFDVYEADMSSGASSWTNVRPLNKPINSGYDELHFLLKDSKTGTDAYFSSNMPIDTVDATYVDPAMRACCWDIFQVDYEIKLLVHTLLASNGRNVPLNGATLSLYVETPTGSKLDTTLTQTSANSFFFTLLPNKKYTLVGKHPDFNYEQTSTIDPIRTEYLGRDTVKREFIFAPVKLLVNSFKRRNGEALDSTLVAVASADGKNVTGTPVDNNTVSFEVQRGKQYQITGTRPGFQDETANADLTSSTYRDSTQIERNLYFRQELEVLVLDASNNNQPLGGATVDRKLVSGTTSLDVNTAQAAINSFLYGYEKFDMREKYRLTVSKPGYNTEVVDVTFTEQQIRDSKGKFVVRVPLEKRDFQPITLYFDNDIPGPSSRTVTTTSVAYGETYEAYYKRKESFMNFIRTARGYTEGERFTARERYENIFEQELRRSFQQLQELSQDILLQLQQGNAVEVHIEAFCSPLGSSQYNLSLGKRRVDSVLKHFLRYDSGKIAPFHRNKKFTIKGTSNGENKADPRARAALSGADQKNRQKGIFDIFATLERRVEIIEVKINNVGLTSINYNLLKKTTK